MTKINNVMCSILKKSSLRPTKKNACKERLEKSKIAYLYTILLLYQFKCQMVGTGHNLFNRKGVYDIGLYHEAVTLLV